MLKKQLFVLFVILALRPSLGAELLLRAGANYSRFANKGGQSNGQGYWGNYVGLNYSHFTGLSQTEKPGIAYELEKTWPINSLFMLSTGMTVFMSNGTMRDMSRGWLGVSEIIIRYSDIDYRLINASFPLLIKPEIKIFRTSAFYVEVGPSLNLSLFNSANEKLIKWDSQPLDKWEELSFDTRIDNNRMPTIIRNSGILFNIGMGLSVGNVDMKLSCTWSLDNYYNVGHFVIEEKQSLLTVLLGYRIY